jgi:hypothetical protein
MMEAAPVLDKRTKHEYIRQESAEKALVETGDADPGTV